MKASQTTKKDWMKILGVMLGLVILYSLYSSRNSGIPLFQYMSSFFDRILLGLFCLSCVAVFTYILTRKRYTTERENYSRLFMHSPFGIAIHEFDFSKDDYFYVDLNQNFSLMTSVKSSQIGKFVTSIFPREDLEFFIDMYKKVASGEKPMIQFEQAFGPLNKTFSIVAYPLHDKRNRFVTIIQDITEQKKSEQQMELLSTALHAAGDGVIITNDQGKIVWCNQTFCDLSGYTFPELIQQNINIINAPEKNSLDLYRMLWRTITRGDKWKGEIVNKKKNGTFYTEAQTITPLKVDEKTYYIAIKRDITEEKKLKEELVQAKEAAEKSDKLKSEFLAQMSHEIRTPLNSILSFTRLLKNEIQEKIEQWFLQEIFPSIERSSERIIRTIDLILKVSEIQTGNYEYKPKQINISDVIQGLCQEFHILAQEKGLKTSCPTRNSKFSIIADEPSVTTIFQNLIDNAVKFTESGKVEVRFIKKKKSFVVEVEDTGVGISQEYLPTIFHPFSQEEQGYTRKFDGNGLGLSLVKKYCELNNAEIEVESEKGKGTIFRVSFPLN